MGIKWKTQEKQMLQSQLANGTPLDKVQIPGRNYEGIRKQAKKLRLIPRLSSEPWTTEQKQKLIELRAQGVTPTEIANFNLLGSPQRTVIAVFKACSKLGLAHENRSQASRNRKVWKGNEKQIFIAFLRQHSKTLTPEQIAERFRLKKVTVSAWQRRLGVKLTFQEILALPYIKRKMQKVYQQKSQKMLAGFEAKMAKKRAAFKALAEKVRRANRALPLGEKCCATCGCSWPKHRNFFYYSVTRVGGLTCWNFFAHCKICTSIQRHNKNLEQHRQKYCA